jgi:hypothetical protein
MLFFFLHYGFNACLLILEYFLDFFVQTISGFAGALVALPFLLFQ